MTIAKEDPGRVKIFNAEIGIKELHEQIRAIVLNHLTS
jgi:thymidylate kinase